jgi:hypothetical protein
MSAASLIKARARKAELTVERVLAEVERVKDFREWVPLEREAYERFCAMRRDFGYDASETQDAHSDWLQVWREKPATPDDASPAWAVT